AGSSTPRWPTSRPPGRGSATRRHGRRPGQRRPAARPPEPGLTHDQPHRTPPKWPQLLIPRAAAGVENVYEFPLLEGSSLRTRLSAALFAVTLAALTATSVAPATGDAPASPGNSAAGTNHRPVCGPANPGEARCNSEVVTDAQGRPLATSKYVNGFGTADLKSAYNLTSATGGSGQT